MADCAPAGDAGAVASPPPWDELDANDWRPWSMQKPVRTPGLWCQRGWFHLNVPQDGKPECIVCYSEPDDTAESGLEHWTSCRQCSAFWCNSCMEAMYNRVRDEQELDDVELTCPQCRKPVPEMQDDARLERLRRVVRERPPYAPPLEVLKSAERQKEFCARVIMDYENLVSELVHLCKAQPGGLPYFTMPTEAVARILSRDESVVGLVKSLQGQSADQKLRRCLRGGDFSGAAAIVIKGYGFWLQNLERGASSAAVLQELLDHLRSVDAAATPPMPVKELIAVLDRIVKNAREKENAAQPAAAPAGKRRKRA